MQLGLAVKHVVWLGWSVEALDRKGLMLPRETNVVGAWDVTVTTSTVSLRRGVCQSDRLNTIDSIHTVQLC